MLHRYYNEFEYVRHWNNSQNNHDSHKEAGFHDLVNSGKCTFGYATGKLIVTRSHTISYLRYEMKICSGAFGWQYLRIRYVFDQSAADCYRFGTKGWVDAGRQGGEM
ncbi:hypothetical protein YTPLAS18_32760 [Nitrospira sp.]|nr:hypothetical protein YTPLAS18_32760 [Nitrospira sp.]